MIYRILKQLENAWKGAETFFKVHSVEEKGMIIKSGADVDSRGKTSIRRKLVWAIKDRKRFMALLTDVGKLFRSWITWSPIVVLILRSELWRWRFP